MSLAIGFAIGFVLGMLFVAYMFHRVCESGVVISFRDGRVVFETEKERNYRLTSYDCIYPNPFVSATSEQLGAKKNDH